ncbi:MAG: hypothetical protein M3R61_04940, partial [Chloroflexota bacterium]|nr:hypothetical protein [Chloroflexota bacterium]
MSRRDAGGKGRPNGLVFSCRERARQSHSKSNDLARAAVGWNTVLGCRIVAVWRSDAQKKSCAMARHEARCDTPAAVRAK